MSNKPQKTIPDEIDIQYIPVYSKPVNQNSGCGERLNIDFLTVFQIRLELDGCTYSVWVFKPIVHYKIQLVILVGNWGLN